MAGALPAHEHDVVAGLRRALDLRHVLVAAHQDRLVDREEWRHCVVVVVVIIIIEGRRRGGRVVVVDLHRRGRRVGVGLGIKRRRGRRLVVGRIVVVERAQHVPLVRAVAIRAADDGVGVVERHDDERHRPAL